MFSKSALVFERIEKMHVEGGYKTITPIEIANCVHVLSQKEISYRAVQVYFGCLAIVAVRDAARRTALKTRRKPSESPRYRISELCAITELSEKAVRRDLRALKNAGLLNFSKTSITTPAEPRPGSTALAQALAGKRSLNRPIPIPRSVLRFLARSQKPALGKTLLAYVTRGMTIDRETGEVRGVGTVKASWISETLGISLRAAKGARKELITLNLISKDEASIQRKLNRDGAYFRVNLAWKEGSTEVRFRKPKVIIHVGKSEPRIAPRLAEKALTFAPPIKDKKTPYGSKNQKAWRAKPAGVSSKLGEGKALLPVTLKNVQKEDLLSFSRSEELYRQARDSGLVGSSEAARLSWFAAAVRAKLVKDGDPVRVFLGIVRNRLWHHITQEEEDRARRAINRYRDRESTLDRSQLGN